MAAQGRPKCLAAGRSVGGRRIARARARHIRGSARTEACHERPEGRHGAGTRVGRASAGMAEYGRGARCRAGRGGNPCRAWRRATRGTAVPNGWRAGCRKGHAAAAACDGKGTRVDGPCRTKVRGPATLTGTGSPIRTKHTPHPPPAAVAAAGRLQPLPAHWTPTKIPDFPEGLHANPRSSRSTRSAVSRAPIAGAQRFPVDRRRCRA